MVKVLIVDDAKFMRGLIRKSLEEAGFEVVGEAENGDQAIELLKSTDPDVVTLDIVMPDKNGLEVLREMLKIKPNLNVIIVSAMGQTDIIAEALRIGAKDYVIKPFQPQVVVDVIRRVLGI